MSIYGTEGFQGDILSIYGTEGFQGDILSIYGTEGFQGDILSIYGTEGFRGDIKMYPIMPRRETLYWTSDDKKRSPCDNFFIHVPQTPRKLIHFSCWAN